MPLSGPAGPFRVVRDVPKSDIHSAGEYQIGDVYARSVVVIGSRIKAFKQFRRNEEISHRKIMVEK